MRIDGQRVFRHIRLGVPCVALLYLADACAPKARPVHSAVEYGPSEPPRDEPPRAQERVEEKKPIPLEPAADKPVSVPEVPAVVRKLEALGPFYDAIDELRNGRRGKSVRILWLGDSHTAADFMTQPVRERIASFGGDGGPGFVRLGLDGYRHGAVQVKPYGRWRKAPILPAQRTRVLDGVFGYGGIRTLPAAGAGVTLSPREARGEELMWTLSLRLAHTSKVDLMLGETKMRVVPEEETIAGGGQFVTLNGLDTDELSLQHVGGDPEIFGVFGDYEEPGVVLDTVGINGARTATALAWEPDQFVAQVSAREPDLLVLAFGTNEVFDQTNPERYVEHNEKLVGLVRQARPNIPCWIVGPPDSSTKEGTSKARVTQVTDAQARAAENLGCAFTSAFELMGGEGSFNRWAREKPAKARSDRIHLTIAGYRELGRLLGLELIDGIPLSETHASLRDDDSSRTFPKIPADVEPDTESNGEFQPKDSPNAH